MKLCWQSSNCKSAFFTLSWGSRFFDIQALGKILTCVYNFMCDNLFNNFNLFLRSNLLHSETKKAFPVTEDQARVT